jgi:hypothetical protein
MACLECCSFNAQMKPGRAHTQNRARMFSFLLAVGGVRAFIDHYAAAITDMSNYSAVIGVDSTNVARRQTQGRASAVLVIDNVPILAPTRLSAYTVYNGVFTVSPPVRLNGDNESHSHSR